MFVLEKGKFPRR